MKVAAYIYKPIDKFYNFSEMTNYLLLKAKESDIEVDEIYADGWDDIPNGIEELLSDVDNYNAILLYSLDGLDETQIKYLGKNMIYCINAPWIKGSNKNNNSTNQLCSTLRASEYYANMRSLNIRMGIKASNKRSGAAPFGYKYGESGLVEVPENKAILDNILNWRKKGVSVKEISEKTKLSAPKIYGILNYWNKPMKNPDETFLIPKIDGKNEGI